MLLRNHPDRIRITLDDHHLVNNNDHMRDVRQSPVCWTGGQPGILPIPVQGLE